MFKKIILEKLQKSLIIIDKKPKRTSHEEVEKIRRGIKKITGLKIKTGHSGTLDPKVTGVLVLGLGKGTKVLEYILLSEKKYLARFEFHKKITREVFEKLSQEFVGKIIQLPPQKSAVKRVEREREVYEIKILNFDKNQRWVDLIISVERGTYIRKLAHDMGEKIGIGIHMGDLRRTQAGPYSLKDNLIGSEEFLNLLKKFWKANFLQFFYYWKLKKYFYSIEDLFLRLDRLRKVKKIEIKDEAVKFLLNGSWLRKFNLKEKVEIEKGKLYSVWNQNRVIAVCEGIEKNQKGEILKIKKIL